MRCYKGREQIIVQCKHYEKSGFAKLKSILKKELISVRELQPTKYIIVTSVGLTPDNKDELLQLFSGIPIESKDIIDSTEINSILTKNPKMEINNIRH